LDVKQNQIHRQGKAPGAGAAGVEVKDPIFALHMRTVGVAEDHRGQARRRGVQVQAEEFVEDVELDLPHLHHLGLGEGPAEVAPVGIAPHRVDRGQGPQRLQNLGAANVPGVDDQFHPPQGLQRLGPQQPMGVGNYADAMLRH